MVRSPEGAGWSGALQRRIERDRHRLGHGSRQLLDDGRSVRRRAQQRPEAPLQEIDAASTAEILAKPVVGGAAESRAALRDRGPGD